MHCAGFGFFVFRGPMLSRLSLVGPVVAAGVIFTVAARADDAAIDAIKKTPARGGRLPDQKVHDKHGPSNLDI
jgi:hypothetical protein